MATVELDIGGKPTRVQVDDGFTPEDLDHIAKSLSAAPADSATTTTPSSSWEDRALSYVTKRGGEIAGAAKRLSQVVPDEGQSTFTEKLGKFGQSAADVATVGAPALTIPLSVAGTVAGTTAAAAGLPNPEIADIATNVVGGLAGGVKGAIRGGKAAKEVISEGKTLRAAVPGVRQAIGTATSEKFDPIIGGLQKTGRILRRETPQGDELVQGLKDALESPFVKGAERRVIESVLARFETTGAGGLRVGSLAPQEIDDAMKALNATGKGWMAKKALNGAINSLATGTPLEGQLSNAQRWYHATVIPAQQMAKAMANKTPGGAATAVMRVWNNLDDASRALIDPQGTIGPIVKSAMKSHRGVLAAAGGFGAMGASAWAIKKFAEGDVEGGMKALLMGVPGLAVRYPQVAVGAVKGGIGGVVPGAVGAAGVGIPAAQRQSTPQAGEVRTLPQPPPIQEPEAEEPDAAPPQRGAARGVMGGYGHEVGMASQLTGIPPRLMRTFLRRENPQMDPRVSSPQGAIGLGQILPSTFEQLAPKIEALTGRRASITDPLSSLVGMGLYIREGLEKNKGDVAGAASYYHGGPDLRQHGPRTAAYSQWVSSNF